MWLCRSVRVTGARLWLCGCGRVAVTIRVPGDLRESGFTGWQLCDENERMR